MWYESFTQGVILENTYRTVKKWDRKGKTAKESGVVVQVTSRLSCLRVISSRPDARLSKAAGVFIFQFLLLIVQGLLGRGNYSLPPFVCRLRSSRWRVAGGCNWRLLGHCAHKWLMKSWEHIGKASSVSVHVIPCPIQICICATI